MDKKRLTNIMADVAWVKGFLEGYSDKTDECINKLDDVLAELHNELEQKDEM